MTQRFIMIILIIVIVMGGGFYAYNQLAPEEVKEAEGPVYSTKEVKKGDISVGVEANGRLNETHGGAIRVPGGGYGPSSVSYVIDKILVEDGDPVKKGQLLIKLKSTDLENKIESKQDELEIKKDQLSDMVGVPVDDIKSISPAKGITLKTPIKGRVTKLDVEEGDELELGYTVCRIVDDSKFEVRAKLTQVEISKVKEGQKVVLKFPYFSGFYDAKIKHINPNPMPSNEDDGFAKGFVYSVTIIGENPGLVQQGMDVRVGLPEEDGSTDRVNLFANTAKVDKFIEEKRVINRAEGIVTEVYIHNMDVVDEGDAIVSMAGADMQENIQEKMDEIREIETDLSTLNSKLEQLEIKASMDGVIGYLNKQEGDTINEREFIGSIFNTNKMMMWVQIDDVDILNVKQDAPVEITVDAVPGEKFEGKVEHVSTRGRDNNGITKFDVTIAVKGGPQLRPGMQANAFIDAGSAEDVLLVPLEGIFEEDGKPMVEILDKDGTVKLKRIELGLMNDRFAEVKKGVEEGDKIITGSSEDLLPSEHIKSDDPILPDSGDDSNEESE